MTTDKPFRAYKRGLRRLLAVLGKDHPRLPEVLILHHRLMQNMEDTAEQPTNPTLDASRARILESCNRISQILIGKSFYALCGLSTGTARKHTGILSTDKEPRAPIDRYFDEMNQLLQDAELRAPTANTSARASAREKTLAILQELDGVQKSHVVQFLYEAGLITEGPGVIFLLEADLSGARLQGASLIEAHLAGTNLQGASFNAAHLEWARLGEAQLQEASLARTYLVAAHLANAKLRETNLNHAHLLGANLSGVDLTNAHLDYAHMHWVNLLAANLQGASLVHAQLIGAELQGANLANTDLRGADLTEAHFLNLRMRGALYNGETRWPTGFDPVGAGARKAEDS